MSQKTVLDWEHLNDTDVAWRQTALWMKIIRIQTKMANEMQFYVDTHFSNN